MKKSDIGIALYLLAAVVFFIVPISSTLLDVMLALNISIAMIVPVQVIYADQQKTVHCLCCVFIQFLLAFLLKLRTIHDLFDLLSELMFL